MSALPVEHTPNGAPSLEPAIEIACERIAPTWPLDRFIAVNPLWGFLDQPVHAASAHVASLAGSRFLMPRAWYQARWHEGALRPEHLREALRRQASDLSLDQLVAALLAGEPATPRRARMTDVVDAERDTAHAVSWCDFVTHSLSQHCAAYFDDGQASLGLQKADGLFGSWRRQAEGDLSPRLLMGLRHYRDALHDLPADPGRLLVVATAALGIAPAERPAYFTSLLLSINGWAAWCAHARWQARLAGSRDDHPVQLLAMRLAWEWLLYRAYRSPALDARWQKVMVAWPQRDAEAARAQAVDWILQRAVEIAHEVPLSRGLARATHPVAAPEPAPDVQAVFCIDVRSEVIRRALEAVDPGMRTLGFAGFFGLPVDYLPAGAAAARPQLPALLAPGLRVIDGGVPDDTVARRRDALASATAAKAFRTGPLSAFSYVESLGPLHAGGLLADVFGRTRDAAPDHAGIRPGDVVKFRPRLHAHVDGSPLPVAERVGLAGAMLRGMSLTRDFAPLVLLAGHGSRTTNNPHAAGLDCGACGGQSGEINARAAAALLNDAEVRAGLAAQGIVIPEGTWFVAGLHDTTTDVVALFDLDEAPAGHGAALAALERWLHEAGERARAERAPHLALGTAGGRSLLDRIRRHARHFAEVRPEWGLVNCNAFVVAPRSRTAHLDLGGACFLHEYRSEDDEGYRVLEQIMTAPMIVTHWINMQYYASTVDNRRFGSGNKVLHNVVGGHIGVFEGNGGDLRIGLPVQSLHDGTRWVHTPLRLAVFIEAPAPAIDGVIAAHETVRQLVDNEWVRLFRIDAASGAVEARWRGEWISAAGAVPH